MRREIPLRNLKTWANSIKARVLFETNSPNTVLRMCAWKPALAFSIVTMIKRTTATRVYSTLLMEVQKHSSNVEVSLPFPYHGTTKKNPSDNSLVERGLRGFPCWLGENILANLNHELYPYVNPKPPNTFSKGRRSRHLKPCQLTSEEFRNILKRPQ